MKQLAGLILAFGVGLVVGTAGSDDSLIEQALERESTAYDRGHADAVEKFRSIAHQAGLATWELDPSTGRSDHFVWTLPRSMDSAPLEEFMSPRVELSQRP